MELSGSYLLLYLSTPISRRLFHEAQGEKPRSVAMKLSGHKTESIYRRYAIVSPADLGEAVERLSRLHQQEPQEGSPKVLDMAAARGKKG